MGKYIYSLVIFFLINLSLHAHKFDGFENSCLDSSLVFNFKSPNADLNTFFIPPVVTSPIYYCQNSPAIPLAATQSPGGTLNWYGTNAFGGVASAIAPTPLTTVVGTISYYVSETVSGVESTRSKIDVIVVADNGATILNFSCDPSQIPIYSSGYSPPATINNSVFFEWSNNPPLIPDNSYNYSYSIDGGPIVTGNTGLSHYLVPNMLPGQSATLTLTAATRPCAPALTITCSVPCGASTVTPNFPAIASFCSGTVAPILGNTSPNGITGTWSPVLISNTVNDSYVFTPNPTLFPCATTQTLTVTITPLATPTFTGIPATVCQNATAPILPISSNNVPVISGSWSPSTVNTAVLGPVTYTFIPTPGQCTSAIPTTVSINIVPVVTPNFLNIPSLCSGKTPPILTNTSPNGIVGSWNPAVINNAANGNYVFTPNPNQCATTQTLNVTITPRTVPDFPAIPSFCIGTTAPLLTATSPNGISGTWSPPLISNTASDSYIFTPNATECATTQTLSVSVNQLIDPGFNHVSMCSGSVAPILNAISPKGITGSWLPSVIDNSTSGTYDFLPDPNQCASPQKINVTVNPSNTLVNVDWTVTDAFVDNQIITVLASLAGNYLYQLDFGAFQTSSIFENVSSGLHSITVNDANGCSSPITINNVLVIDYPRFFTPNGDNYNDTWNIVTLKDQTASVIRIFDRYGKFLKEISPTGNGWDGIYNGQSMPSTDYWFVVDYADQNGLKKFKSHFSLKR
jgi:gliding motility-associated-like protein